MRSSELTGGSRVRRARSAFALRTAGGGGYGHGGQHQQMLWGMLAGVPGYGWATVRMSGRPSATPMGWIGGSCKCSDAATRNGTYCSTAR